MGKTGYRSVTIRDAVYDLLAAVMEAEHRSSMSATIEHVTKQYVQQQEGGDKHGS